MIDETQWFNELRDKFAGDPEYITHGLLLDITARICEEMEEQGVSRSELAERLGVARQRVTHFLKTPTNTTLLTIVRFAEALGVSVKVAVEPSLPKVVSEDPNVADFLAHLQKSHLRVAQLPTAERREVPNDLTIAA